MFSKILNKLLLYVKDCYKKSVTEIPTATILMGINMPDHATQFEELSEQIKFEISPHVALINPEDSSNVKLMVENMVFQFVNHYEYDVRCSSIKSIKYSITMHVYFYSCKTFFS